MLSLIPYRTRKSEKMSGKGENRLVDSDCAGIDSRRAGPLTMSKERSFFARKQALALSFARILVRVFLLTSKTFATKYYCEID
jgi:hypothetical protein